MAKQIINLKKPEVWFIIGSQHLYGNKVLKHVHTNAIQIAKSFEANKSIPAKVTYKKVLTSSSEIFKHIKDDSMDAHLLSS